MGLVKRGGETRRRGRRNCGRDIKTKKCKTKQKGSGLCKTGRTLEIRLCAIGRDTRDRFTLKALPQDPRPLGPNNLLQMPRHQPTLPSRAFNVARVPPPNVQKAEESPSLFSTLGRSIAY